MRSNESQAAMKPDRETQRQTDRQTDGRTDKQTDTCLLPEQRLSWMSPRWPSRDRLAHKIQSTRNDGAIGFSSVQLRRNHFGACVTQTVSTRRPLAYLSLSLSPLEN